MQNCVGSRSVVFGHESVVLGVLVLKDGARSSGVWGGGELKGPYKTRVG